MASILKITASPYGTASRGSLLAQRAIANLHAGDPTLRVVDRNLSDLSETTVQAAYSEAVLGGHAHDHEAFVLSETLIRELEEAKYVLLATPMHNYTVPASLKLWIDMVLRWGRSFAPSDGAKVGLLRDRPMLVLVTAGSLLRQAGVGQPDHLTGYVRDVLSTIGIDDLRFLYLDGLASPTRAEEVYRAAEQAIDHDTAFGTQAAAAA
ncbi:NAD(P)H-dependent oxidoreductase [Sphingomonas sp. BK235]|uniref:FMN-dependent NADH-azoreductase n=1 Tax=Sphingomonas sp. BK235 TaxID=2512131 RepID=UPI00104F2C81|nr:NAD(P)H-dependent oxidoreductase [Sphingomonas sp. BK235]TCP36065.1 FMN-dependent NADH-azoreductase [Sphingomonas sp. BK235]